MGFKMTKLYIYSSETNKLVARIEGADNAACEAVASELYGDTDRFGWTYRPAFGFAGGIASGEEVEDFEIDSDKLVPKGRASNPAPRIGAARPRRKSQVTGKKPSMRLVQRREKNTRKGYYPNPIDATVPAGEIYEVQQKKRGKGMVYVGTFASRDKAVKFARALADSEGLPVQVKTVYHGGRAKMAGE